MSIKEIKTVIEGEAEHSHFFVSTAYFWTIDASLVNALEKLKAQYKYESTKTKKNALVNVFYVPVPSTAIYNIRMFAPEVDGTAFLFQGKLFPHLNK